VHRRRLVCLVPSGLAALSLPALAQTERQVRRIGYPSLASAQANGPWLDAFRAGMLELRWVEGRDYVIDARYTNGLTQAGPALAAELVATRRQDLQGRETGRPANRAANQVRAGREHEDRQGDRRHVPASVHVTGRSRDRVKCCDVETMRWSATVRA
jgi:hypothetical protein